MLIVPVSGQPDWRRPPLILLLLILINVLVFFGAQGRDDERTLHAARYYFDSALPGIELPRYVAELERHRPADALPLQKALDKKRPQRVLRAMENDAAFMRRLHAEQIVTPEAPEFARWRSERRHYETLRDKSTSQRLGFKPAEPTVASLFAHMFLHGDLMHLIGNMAILFVVGLLVEEKLGKTRFLLFYLLCGLGAAALDWAVDSQRTIPGIGASGAVSGVMAMFVMLYGLQKIRFFYWLVVYFDFFMAPAILVLPVWIGWELVQYLNAGNSQINYLAHLGGFLTGTLLIAMLRRFGPALKTATEPPLVSDPLVAERQRLTGHLEQLRFAEAVHSARRCTRLAPHDAALLEQYYMLARGQPGSDDYHRAAAQIFARAEDVAHGEFAYRTFKDYFKTARPSVRLASAQLTTLIRGFARNGYLDDAERLSLALARRDAQHPALPALLLLLAEAYRRAGNGSRRHALLERLRQEHPNSEEALRAGTL